MWAIYDSKCMQPTSTTHQTSHYVALNCLLVMVHLPFGEPLGKQLCQKKEKMSVEGLQVDVCRYFMLYSVHTLILNPRGVCSCMLNSIYLAKHEFGTKHSTAKANTIQVLLNLHPPLVQHPHTKTRAMIGEHTLIQAH